ncbi:hypothetical protein GQ44DRAFT_830943 [Phaeosphaeriaceae sp. PMI808]|nr:hypothetical protein GQ44DRAFT_830943 [Phaeosphaeriaceae sp. PMI808]
MVALGIFVMTPKAAPLTALLSGIFLNKGFGTQVMLVDSLVSIASFWLMSTIEGTFKGPQVPPSITDPEKPAKLWLIYLGLYLATLPGFVIGALYFISGCALYPLFIVSFCLRMTVFAKLAFKIWLAWICFFAFFLASPFLAIWEIGWKIFVKDKDRVFPPLRFFRRLFGKGSHWIAWVGRYILYWIWVAFVFTVFLGRWMFLVNILQLAGDAFCPSSLTPAAISGVLLTFAAAAGSFALSVLGMKV